MPIVIVVQYDNRYIVILCLFYVVYIEFVCVFLLLFMSDCVLSYKEIKAYSRVLRFLRSSDIKSDLLKLPYHSRGMEQCSSYRRAE